MRLLCPRSINILLNSAFDNSSNVVWLPFIFWTILIPSMIQADLAGIMSTGNARFSKAFQREALLVFLRVPSDAPKAQGIGPNG